MVWFPTSFLPVLSSHLFPCTLAGAGAVKRLSGSVSPLSPDVTSQGRLPLFLRACFHSSPPSSRWWAGCCHEMCWLGQSFIVSPHVPLCLPPSFHASCFPSQFVFLTRLLGWMLSRDGLAWLALCLPACFPHALAGLDAVTRWSGSVSSLSPTCFHLCRRRHEMVWLS